MFMLLVQILVFYLLMLLPNLEAGVMKYMYGLFHSRNLCLFMLDLWKKGGLNIECMVACHNS